MPIVTRYVCDQCAKSQAEPFQMWTLTFILAPINASGQAQQPFAKGPNPVWCRACCERFGLLPPDELRTELSKAPPPVPTLDSLVKAIADRAAAEAVAERDGQGR